MNATHAAIVLAAGASRRLGTSKQVLQVDGEPLLRRAVCAAIDTLPERVVVVVGANAETALATLVDLPIVRVDCPDWADGMSASLRAGIRAIAPTPHIAAALVLVCDQPALDAGHLRALLHAWRKHPERACASAYAGVLGVPAVLPRSWFTRVAGVTGDQGARELLRASANQVSAVAAPSLQFDIDTPTDPSFASGQD